MKISKINQNFMKFLNIGKFFHPYFYSLSCIRFVARNMKIHEILLDLYVKFVDKIIIEFNIFLISSKNIATISNFNFQLFDIFIIIFRIFNFFSLILVKKLDFEINVSKYLEDIDILLFS